MNRCTTYARFSAWRLLAGGAVVALTAGGALAQNGLPVFETRYALSYQFPPESIEVLPGAFRTSITGSEKIQRDERETTMRYDGSLGFTLAARPLTSSDNLPQGAVDLYVRLTDVEMRCRAGRGSYSIIVNGEGLREVRPMSGETRFGPHDQYVGSHTVSSLLAKPGTLRFSNGALLAAPAESPMLSTLECSWMYTGITSILPPLPSKGIVPGQTWTAGMPVRLSVFGQPQIIRFDLKFEEYNESTHVARVSWKANLVNTSVMPAAGIHHVGQDAVASGLISGEVRLHVDSGTVMGSTMSVDLDIRHIKSSKTTVHCDLKYVLENLDLAQAGQPSLSTAGPEEMGGQP